VIKQSFVEAEVLVANSRGNGWIVCASLSSQWLEERMIAAFLLFSMV
jgi:hypothetical protein